MAGEGVHPTAVVDPGARLGPGVTVGAFTQLGPRVVLGAGSVVGSHCSLGVDNPGQELVLGDGALIRSHSVFYGGSTFGAGLHTGHGVTCREGLDVGVDVQLGTLCDLQGDARIGRHTRLHSNVHIGKHSDVGAFVWIFPYVVLTNDPHPPSEVQQGVTVEEFAVIATMSVVLPGIRIGRGAVVGAGSTVTRDVEPDVLVAGSPAKERGSVERLSHVELGGPAYPWRRHFHRGYPDDVVEDWKHEFSSETGTS